MMPKGMSGGMWGGEGGKGGKSGVSEDKTRGLMNLRWMMERRGCNITFAPKVWRMGGDYPIATKKKCD